MKTLLWKLAGWMAEISELDTKPAYQAIEDAAFIRRAPCLQGVVGSASSLYTTIQDGPFESSTCIIFSLLALQYPGTADSSLASRNSSLQVRSFMPQCVCAPFTKEHSLKEVLREAQFGAPAGEGWREQSASENRELGERQLLPVYGAASGQVANRLDGIRYRKAILIL